MANLKPNLEKLAHQIDKATDESDLQGVQNALSEIKQYNFELLSDIECASLYFFKANCYQSLRIIDNEHLQWAWENEHITKEIICLRLSLKILKKLPIAEDKTDLRFRVRTNLANLFSHLGRFVEAIAYWDEAIAEYPTFAMAIANKGNCLFHYARYVYDPSHQFILLSESFQHLTKGLYLGLEPHAKIGVSKQVLHLLTLEDWEQVDRSYANEEPAKETEEAQYRKWCTEHQLFINPLNDVLNNQLVQHDILTFPSMTIENKSEYQGTPEAFGIYNQLKQEYVSARYTVYAALQASQQEIHFSDKETALYDLLDFRCYQLWVEQLKMAFLSLYAIFDKLAFLINHYWQLNTPAHKIAFKTIWYNKKTLHRCFAESENWALRGLFWLSKDFYINQTTISTEPEAYHLNQIRNHIAHKYLKVYNGEIVSSTKNFAQDETFYPITSTDFIEQTIKLLKLVRSSLIYLPLAVYIEEAKQDKSDLAFPMMMNLVGDDFR